MLNAENLADIDASDCDSLSDHLQYSLKGDYKYENVPLSTCDACATKATADRQAVKCVDAETIVADEPSTSLFSIVRRRSSKKRWMARRRRHDASADEMSRSHHAGDDSYGGSVASTVQHSFIIDPYRWRDQRSLKDYCGGDHRAKSLDNLQRYGVMSSLFCGTLDTKEKKSGGSSLGFAKSLLRRLYSTSTTKLGLNNGKDTTYSQTTEFKTAISPFFQMRLPEPEERPYLPYNIYYQVENDNTASGNPLSGLNDDDDTDVDFTLTYTPQHIDNEVAQRLDNVKIPLSASSQNISAKISAQTPYRIQPGNFPADDRLLLRQKQVPEPCLNYGGVSARTRPVVHGRWNYIDKTPATVNAIRATTGDHVNHALCISTKLKRNKKPESKIVAGSSPKDASLNDSSSLGYSTISAQTISDDRFGDENDIHESFGSTENHIFFHRKVARSSSAKPHTALRIASSAAIDRHSTTDGVPNWPNASEPTATFSNFDALFQYLKSEITEIHKRDEKIRRKLADVEFRLRGTAGYAPLT